METAATDIYTFKKIERGGRLRRCLFGERRYAEKRTIVDVKLG